MEKAESRGITPDITNRAVPVPDLNPDKTPVKTDDIRTGSIEKSTPGNQFASAFAIRGGKETKANPNRVQDENLFTNQLFGEVANSIDVIERSQKQRIDLMRIAANQRSARLTKVLKGLGVRIAEDPQANVGGPFEPLNENTNFGVYVQTLEESLGRYDTLSKKAKSLPLSYPVKKPIISSRYGTRVDPFNGRAAMHSGIDFKAPSGTRVYTTGDGKVIEAGRKGGFGKMVAVRHKNGLVTRYAHLSRINVKTGEWISKGKMVGKVGSTGRSTGPHLHYEIRSGKKAYDPTRFIVAGRKIRDLL
ncbi:MAG: M23 family metallopeptidase, partial [Pseudomonadota bacterium]